jgi:hypothetical protein
LEKGREAENIDTSSAPAGVILSVQDIIPLIFFIGFSFHYGRCAHAHYNKSLAEMTRQRLTQHRIKRRRENLKDNTAKSVKSILYILSL